MPYTRTFYRFTLWLRPQFFMSQELDKMKNQIVEQAAEALAELFVIQLDNISGVATAKEVDKL